MDLSHCFYAEPREMFSSLSASVRVRSRRLQDESQAVPRGPTCPACLYFHAWGTLTKLYIDLDSALEVILAPDEQGHLPDPSSRSPC